MGEKIEDLGAVVERERDLGAARSREMVREAAMFASFSSFERKRLTEGWF